MSKENIAKPHTIKKFELIEKYVVGWAHKILNYKRRDGANLPKGVVYIDCMSSSGMYEAEDGKPIKGTALRVISRLKEIMPNYPNKKALLFFNDIDNSKIELLKDEIGKERLENIKNIEVKCYVEDCNEFLRKLDLKDFEGYNTLLLYDPYEAKINWPVLKPFFQRWGEVIINHMVSDTVRAVAQAKNPKTVKKYQGTYQQEDISSLVDKSKSELDKIILKIIIELKKDNPNVRIALFAFFSRTNGHIYSLIHCSSSLIGFKLFKSVAWKTFGDKSSTKNTHGNDRQVEFDFFDYTDEECYSIKDIAKYLCRKYQGKVVSSKTIWRDLDEHPIFPSDGYKNKIKEELKKYFHVKFDKAGNFTFPSGK